MIVTRAPTEEPNDAQRNEGEHALLPHRPAEDRTFEAVEIVAGTAVGAGLGAVIGGPVGAAIGGAIGAAAGLVGGEALERAEGRAAETTDATEPIGR